MLDIFIFDKDVIPYIFQFTSHNLNRKPCEVAVAKLYMEMYRDCINSTSGKVLKYV